MNTYEFTITAICPNQPTLRDVYECRLKSVEMIECEQIRDFRAWIVKEKIFQEALADLLKDKFNCHVELCGQHLGVLTTCDRP